MEFGMLVVDPQDRIVDINPAMKAFVGISDQMVIGRVVDQVFIDRPELALKFQHETDLKTVISLADDDAHQKYELQISQIFNQHHLLKGKLIELRDISQHQQALAEQNRYAEENAQLLVAESHQRQLAESLRQTMMILSGSLDRDEIVSEILAQLKMVLPYHSAALYLLADDELRLEQVVGPEMISGKSYTTPRRYDQIQKIYQLKKAEVFMSAYSSHPESRGDPVYSSMAAPLVVGQEALGVLTIDRFEPMPFAQENAEILQAFTNQAAIAIKNAEYYQQAADAAVLEERNRLAQDLHDAVNQTLFTASIMAEVLPQVWERDPEQGRQGLQEIRQLTRAALSEMRTLLMELHPQRITEKTLGDLVDHLTRSVSNRIRIPIDLEIVNDTILAAEIQIPFYRVAQEAFNNIMKHAAASQVWVTIDAQPDRALLIIRDNGRGFDPENIQLGHLGVGIMKERAERIGAKLNIKSQPDQGTALSLIWQSEKSSE
jgi:PAS domain S-box-containing protein